MGVRSIQKQNVHTLAMYESVDQAKKALELLDPNCLSKGDFTELKAFKSPPESVKTTLTNLYKIINPEVKISIITWKNCKEMLADPNLMFQLIHFNKDGITADVYEAIQPFVRDENLSEECIRKVAASAAGVRNWICVMSEHYRIKKFIA